MTKKVLGVLFTAGVFFLTCTLVHGEMQIKLLDGKVITVPVKKEDIESITFKAEGRTTYLSDLEPLSARVGWGAMERDIFAGRYKIKLGGIEYSKGLHTHSPASVTYSLDGKYSRFESYVGLWDSGNPNRGKSDDFAGKKGTVVFKVVLDGRVAYNSGVMGWDKTSHVGIPVAGAQKMELIVEDAGDGNGWDWSVWGDAKLLR